MFFTHVERDPCLFRLSRVYRGRMALGILVFSAGILSVLRPVAAWGNENQGAPNIVLIITDDQGYGDLGRHGNPVLKTPHFDKLHCESVRFPDSHAPRYRFTMGRDLGSAAEYCSCQRRDTRRAAPGRNCPA